jgi:hypothetical protein
MTQHHRVGARPLEARSDRYGPDRYGDGTDVPAFRHPPVPVRKGTGRADLRRSAGILPFRLQRNSWTFALNSPLSGRAG